MRIRARMNLSSFSETRPANFTLLHAYMTVLFSVYNIRKELKPQTGQKCYLLLKHIFVKSEGPFRSFFISYFLLYHSLCTALKTISTTCCVSLSISVPTLEKQGLLEGHKPSCSFFYIGESLHDYSVGVRGLSNMKIMLNFANICSA